MKKLIRFIGFFLTIIIVFAAFPSGIVFSKASTKDWNVNQRPLYQLDQRPIVLENYWGDTMHAVAGQLVLPENRRNTGSNRIQIAFGVLKAYQKTDKSPIVILSGGPGGSGIEMGKGRYFYLFKELRKYADVVLLDQRGTGRSIPNLECENNLSLPVDIREDSENILTQSILNSASECLSVFTENGLDLNGYNSGENARDIDDLRRVLDYQKISLFGFSYGTQLAQVYIKLFPDRVEKAILMGPVAPDQSLKLPRNIHSQFIGIDSLVKLDKRLARYMPEFLQTMKAVHQKLIIRPRVLNLQEQISPENTTEEKQILDQNGDPNQSLLQEILTNFHLELIAQSEVGDDYWIRNFPAFYYKMANGDWREAGEKLNVLKNKQMVHGLLISTNCATSYFEERHERGIEEEKLTILSHRSTSFGRMKDRCLSLGLMPLDEEFLHPIKGEMPVLLIGGSLDGRTPLNNLHEIAQRFPNHRKLIIENAGHGNLIDGEVLPHVVNFINDKNSGDLTLHRKVDFIAPVPYRYSLEDTIYHTIVKEGIGRAIASYHRLKKEYEESTDYVFDFGENMLNSLGYRLLQEKRLDAAEAIFKLNIEQYPEAWNAHDSYGEVLVTIEDFSGARKMYQKSVDLNFMNGNGHMALKRIEKNLSAQSYSHNMDLDSLMRSEIQNRRLPGMTVAVIKENEVVFKNAYGISDLEMGTQTLISTRFFIGSVTKQFTATAIMILRERGLLDIRDKISKYIPGLNEIDDKISIETLLNHTSGLSRDYKKKSVAPFSTELLKGEELVNKLNLANLEFNPGENTKYSNMGYVLLGMIIESISGISHEQFLETEIFQPLGMDSSFCIHSSSDLPPDLAKGYEDNGPAEYYTLPPALRYGGGSIVTTVDDMIKWNASLDNHTLISAESQNMMWTPSKLSDGSFASLGTDQSGRQYQMGFGWFIDDNDPSIKIVHHGGGLDGYSAQIDKYLEEDLTIIVLTNREQAGPAAGVSRVLAKYFMSPLEN